MFSTLVITLSTFNALVAFTTLDTNSPSYSDTSSSYTTFSTALSMPKLEVTLLIAFTNSSTFKPDSIPGAFT